LVGYPLTGGNRVFSDGTGFSPVVPDEVIVMTIQMHTPQEPQPSVSRRAFIKGVIATGAAVSTSAYLFRGPAVLGQSSMPGAVERLMTLNVNGQMRRVDVMKQETLAMTLRY